MSIERARVNGRRSAVEQVPRSRAAAATATAMVGVSNQALIRALSDTSQGTELPAQLRLTMGRFFGEDLPQIHLHDDAEASQLARGLNAVAFTRGHHIYFGEGQYAPHRPGGRQLLAHELTHSIQQDHAPVKSSILGEDRTPLELAARHASANASNSHGPSSHSGSPEAVPALQRLTPSAGASQTVDVPDEFQGVIDETAKRHPEWTDALSQITLHVVIDGNRTDFRIAGETPTAYPTLVMKAVQGFYLVSWNAEGNSIAFVSLPSGSAVAEAPQIPIVAGANEAREKRRNRIGVVWIKQTVTEPPVIKQTAGNLELPLPPGLEISMEEYRRYLDLFPKRQLALPGLMGLLDPDYKGPSGRDGYYARPYNLTYYTHTGEFALVSRALVGRDFYYLVPLSYLVDWMRTYPLVAAGLSAEFGVKLAWIMTDISMSFLPIVGPIWVFLQASYGAYEAYKNWDKLSGWEKALAGFNLVLAAIPFVGAAGRAVRGAMLIEEGTTALMARGLSRADARALMLGAMVWRSEAATRTVVSTLGATLLERGTLTAEQISQVEQVFARIVKQLPAAERALVEAAYATQNVERATQFLANVEMTEQRLAGLRRLYQAGGEQLLVVLKTASKTDPILVGNLLIWAERAEEAATAVESLRGVVRSGQLVTVANNLGEDVLRQMGRTGVEISPGLAKYVSAARTARDAYLRLMQGTSRAGLDIAGLATVLSAGRQLGTAGLEAIEQEFGHTFLTVAQLYGLAALGPTLRQALLKASDSELRAIASASASPEAALAINDIGGRLVGVGARNYVVSYVLSYVSGGVLKVVGTAGATVSDDLLRQAGRQISGNRAARVLMEGFTSRSGARIAGLLDIAAGRLPRLTDLELTLTNIGSPAQKAGLFARWALQNPTLVAGVETISRARGAAAEQAIEGIYRAYAGNHAAAMAVFQSLQRLEAIYPGVRNLSPLIADLAAGAEKTMGASLVLDFVTRRAVGTIQAFEEQVSIAGRLRKYDLVADGVEYEFKYWLGFGRNPVAAAMDEFARDVIRHCGSNFENLRWILSSNAMEWAPAIRSMMTGVLSRPSVLAALKAQGISFPEAVRRLNEAHWLIEFF